MNRTVPAILALALCGASAQAPTTGTAPAPQAAGPQAAGPQAAAQQPNSAPASPTALHRAWLCEVLDLDTAGAAQRYARIAEDSRPGNHWRWLAIARRSELQRLDVAGGQRVEPGDVPQEQLQAAFSAADTTLDVAALVQRVDGTPEDVLKALAAPEGALPLLRPIVGAAEDYVLDLLRASRGERDHSRRVRQPFQNRSSFNENVFAPQVLRAELNGTRAQADATRSLYLPRWQPPAVTGSVETNLQRIRFNMQPLLAERESFPLRRLHEQLRDRIEELAVKDPGEAVALVRRLPRYCERLLAPVPENDK